MKNIVVCAGGSGGHVYPAIALCEQLVSAGYNVILLTDKRGNRYCSGLNFKVSVIPTISSSMKTLATTVLNSIKILVGLWVFWRKNKPELIVGFGGVTTILPIIIAKLMRIKTVIHEQNVVIGKANKLLAKIADYVTANYPGIGTTVETPVRQDISNAFASPYSFSGKDKFVITVFGGSQSADKFASIVPKAISLLKASDLQYLKIIQQVNEAKLSDLKAYYDQLGVASDLRPFITDMDEVIKQSSLVISRAGASTLAELATIGRPAILVPYPFAGGHQRLNAEYYENLGAAWVICDDNFNAQNLASRLESLLYNTDQLVIAAVNMLKSRRPSANKKLMEFCEKIIKEV